MGFFQPPVIPIDHTLNLTGKVAIVTGANAGLGFASSRQLLLLNLSTLILAVRTISKGELARDQLLSDPLVKTHNPNPTIHVLQVDLDSYESVLAFVARVNKTYPELHLFLANAGIGTFRYQLSASGHERVMQVNYLSNALLTMELLPLLILTAERTGEPSRITWVGSEMLLKTSLAQNPLRPEEGVLKHFDDKSTFHTIRTYADSKLLGVMFVSSVANIIPKEKVIINVVCPGLVDTNMTDSLPMPFRAIMTLYKKLSARTPQEGAILVVNAVFGVGSESHGGLLYDKTLVPPPDFIQSNEGQQVMKKLWGETLEEMKKVDEVSVQLLA